ncbi:MAG TPA: DNA-3-methyladenine glycosylase 2 family protein [Xanthobacteraceae bacterium]|nr:DNA-3-methyladenine glycosylase 2 family protein [Xanthobacteraceae bacterium]
MSPRIETEADLEAGLAQLVELDPRLNEVLAIAGRPPLRKRAGGFHGLARIVVSQQLSVASASAIWNRVEAAFDPFHHDTVLAARTPKFQRAGLSRPKIKTFRTVARAVRDRRLDLEALHDMPADAAHAALTSVKGIGPWTADIYLLFCIGHADAWPAGDLALQEAIKLAFKLRKRPDAKKMHKLAEGWRPVRGVAAYLFWSYYRALKRRDAVPVGPATETKVA